MLTTYQIRPAQPISPGSWQQIQQNRNILQATFSILFTENEK